MTGKIVNLRNASEEDSKDLWIWRNDVLTRQNSLNEYEVSWDNHTKWFRDSLENPNRTILIATDKLTDEKLGMVRFDVNKEQTAAEVSINLNPQWKGKNLSSTILKMAIDIFSQSIVCVLVAEIKPLNKPSIKCFEASGFSLYESNDDLLILKNKEIIINQIEKIRARNNVNWMELMRLAFRTAPKEAEKIFYRVNKDDGEINILLNKLLS